ncbi:50S ribosomal protein L23 [Deinococcus cellulosilyticus]|uniref:Large ribosomal subunit protein uL23 n=1 Tax=Deinococcus cellulosilyticus (strain DSM 18568 / NBRC 106333 / KACC 11606 / 5516J-15) TaxID=1223518 RepID=A0A511N707_DEIC1|nr:50S ribosomal protein L23 [Deinococcus cellulosilyticus]GEM48634.1 50S ribosomal protein L23 [Deinococcus cellulosilyticus NBRC 106333 = KACC 11606]
MSHFDTIKAPVVSEKAFAGIENGVYSFWVDPRVTKVEIKAAVEAVFGVKVDSVNTQNLVGKVKRAGRFTGKRIDRKKAIVKLKEGQKIEALENLV